MGPAVIKPGFPLPKLAGKFALNNIKRRVEITRCPGGVHRTARKVQFHSRTVTGTRSTVCFPRENHRCSQNRVIDRFEMADLFSSEIADWIGKVKATWNDMDVHGA